MYIRWIYDAEKVQRCTESMPRDSAQLEEVIAARKTNWNSDNPNENPPTATTIYHQNTINLLQ